MQNKREHQSKKRPKIAYILNVFPKLSETFILSEIRRCIQNFNLSLYALFLPQEDERNPDAEDLVERTVFLTALQNPFNLFGSHLFFILRRPFAYFTTFVFAFHNRNIRSSWQLVKSLLRTMISGGKKSTKKERQNILLHFFLVTPLARAIYKDKVDLIHAHFADAATSFTMLISRLTGVPYSFTTHATDIFVPQELPEEKILAASFVITCTEYNKKYLCSNYPDLNCKKIHVVYHGLDVQKFTPSKKKSASESPVLLSVGRLVKKKGIGVLIKACATLKEQGCDFQCRIVGDGPERARWELACRINHVADRVKFYGSVPPSQMREFYQQAAVFVLPCVIDENGDRDGIPNVIAEAMAMKLPVVSSRISGIPELVEDQKTGYLLDPSDHEALSDVLARLLKNPRKRQTMGRNGRAKVERVFDLDENSQKLAELFREKVTELRREDSR